MIRKNIVAGWALGLVMAAGHAGCVDAQEALGLRSSLSDEADNLGASVPPPPPPANSGTRQRQFENFADTAADGTSLQEPAASDPQAVQTLQAPTEVSTQQAAAISSAQSRRSRQREAEPFAPIGLRTGGFVLFPSLQIGAVFSDNVAQVAHAPQSDIGLRLVPELRIESDWVRHQFNLTGTSELIFYEQESRFDEKTAAVDAALRLDVRRTTFAEFAANYHLSETSAADSEVPDTAIGRRQEHEYGFSSSLTHRMNRLSTTVTAGARHFLFDDVELAGGGVEDNADRNYIEPSAALRIGYDTSPAVQSFVEVGYQPRIHERSRDRSGLRRNSHGGFARAGVALQLSPIWAGNVAIRYDVRDFADSSLDAIHAVGLDADLTWRPSELTSVVWAASSAIDESALGGVSGSRIYESSVAISHALRENVGIGTTAGIEYTDFVGSSQEELELTAGVSLSYLLRREVELLAGYTITGFESTQAGADYIENRVTAGFRFRL